MPKTMRRETELEYVHMIIYMLVEAATLGATPREIKTGL